MPRVKNWNSFPQGSKAVAVKTTPIPTTVVSLSTTKYGQSGGKRGRKGR